MQFRALLAFVLAFLVMILYQMLSAPPEKDRPLPKEGETPVAKKGEQEVTKTIAEIPPPIKKKVGGTGKDVTVSTDLYTAIITEYGARLRSFQLKGYRERIDRNSPLVELVTTTDFGELPLETNFDGGIIKGLETAIFRTDNDSLTLDGGREKGVLHFEWISPEEIRVVKTYSFDSHSYKIDMDVTVDNFTDRVLQGGLRVTLKNNPYSARQGRFTFTGPAALINASLNEIKTEKMDRKKGFSGKISWVGFEDVYFISAVIPNTSQDSLMEVEVKQKDLVYTSHISPPAVIAPKTSAVYRFSLYLGPKDLDVLKTLGHGLEKAVNFGFFQIIAKPLLHVLKFLYKFSYNYGIAIILLTVLVKVVFWPLTHKSYQSMKAMQKLQPQMAKMREKYKNDRQQLNKELMALYRTYKVNPMGGCLPMVLQIPVFFALYKLLLYAIEIRHAPFITYVPLTDRIWLADLSAKDPLYITPVIMGVSMFVQQKMTPTPGDPTQQKFMMILPIVFTFLFLNFPSGLVLYWLVNNILSIGQQYCINRGVSLATLFSKMRRNKTLS